MSPLFENVPLPLTRHKGELLVSQQGKAIMPRLGTGPVRLFSVGGSNQLDFSHRCKIGGKKTREVD